MAEDYSSASEDEKSKYLNHLAFGAKEKDHDSRTPEWHELQRKLEKYEKQILNKEINGEEYSRLTQQATREYDEHYEKEREAREHAWFRKFT